MRKSGLRRTKALISLKRDMMGPRLLLRLNRMLSINAKINTLKGRFALRFKTPLIFGAHYENLNEDISTLSATKL